VLSATRRAVTAPLAGSSRLAAGGMTASPGMQRSVEGGGDRRNSSAATFGFERFWLVVRPNDTIGAAARCSFGARVCTSARLRYGFANPIQLR
jgi:hypothetical protein